MPDLGIRNLYSTAHELEFLRSRLPDPALPDGLPPLHVFARDLDALAGVIATAAQSVALRPAQPAAPEAGHLVTSALRSAMPSTGAALAHLTRAFNAAGFLHAAVQDTRNSDLLQARSRALADVRQGLQEARNALDATVRHLRTQADSLSDHLRAAAARARTNHPLPDGPRRVQPPTPGTGPGPGTAHTPTKGPGR